MELERKSARLFGIDISFLEISYGEITVILIPCADADLFSKAALRRLLLSEKGRRINAAVANSVNGREIILRAEFL